MAKYNPKFCEKVRENAEKWHNYFSENISNYTAMHDFVLGDQMQEEDQRSSPGSFSNDIQFIPLNKLAPICSNIIGEYIFNTPNLQVVPITSDASQIEIDLREDIVKHIAFSSESKMVYRNAAQQAFVGGYSAIVVENEYESDESFNQTIKVSKVEDPTKCFWDMSAEHPSKRDGMYCGRYSMMNRDDFEKKYPTVTKLSNIASSVITNFCWISEDSVAILDYFEKKLIYRGKYLLLNNGDKIKEKDYKKAVEGLKDDLRKVIDFEKTKRKISDEEALAMIEDQLGNYPSVVSEKEYEEWEVIRYKIVGDYILEKTEFPAKQMGVVFVCGENYMDSGTGKQIMQSFFKHAKNPQRMLNYINSQTIDLVKKLRHEQWMATINNISGQERVWADPTNYQGALLYKPEIIGGTVITPEKIPPSQISPTLQQEYSRVMQDISSCLGIYDTQLGNQGNEQSGAAINARTRRGNLRTLPTYEMINLGISQVGNLILQMIPNVYDTHRIITLRTPDGGIRTVEVNIPPVSEYGKVISGVTDGEFMISIQPGQSFEGQKEEYLHSLQMLLQANPQLFALVADKFAENLPMANTNEIANRLKSIVPDRIIAEGKGLNPPPEPEEPNPAMILMQKKMEEMDNDIQIKQRDIERKEKEMMIDAQIKVDKQEIEKEKLELQKMRNQIDAVKAASDIQKNKDDMNLKVYNSLMDDLTGK